MVSKLRAFSLLGFVLLMVACGPDTKKVAPTAPVPAVQSSAPSPAQITEAKMAASQQFQTFRQTGSLSTAVDSALEMRADLAKANLTLADIAVTHAEIVAHIRDCALRSVAKAKRVSHPVSQKRRVYHPAHHR